MRYISLFVSIAVVACGSGSGGGGGGGGDDDGSLPDSGSMNTGQHVVECVGVVQSNQPSNCPKGDCNDESTNPVSCSAYASFVPGSSTGLCNAGATGSYGLVFRKTGESAFYEVIECKSGTPTQHACSFGFMTDPDGYSGMPGYVCTH